MVNDCIPVVVSDLQEDLVTVQKPSFRDQVHKEVMPCRDVATMHVNPAQDYAVGSTGLDVHFNRVAIEKMEIKPVKVALVWSAVISEKDKVLVDNEVFSYLMDEVTD